MRWFMEAEGSRNYEDPATLDALIHKLDTNGDGQVLAACSCCCVAVRD